MQAGYFLKHFNASVLLLQCLHFSPHGNWLRIYNFTILALFLPFPLCFACPYFPFYARIVQTADIYNSTLNLIAACRKKKKK